MVPPSPSVELHITPSPAEECFRHPSTSAEFPTTPQIKFSASYFGIAVSENTLPSCFSFCHRFGSLRKHLRDVPRAAQISAELRITPSPCAAPGHFLEIQIAASELDTSPPLGRTLPHIIASSAGFQTSTSADFQITPQKSSSRHHTLAAHSRTTLAFLFFLPLAWFAT